MLVVICILPEREKTRASSLNRSQIAEEAEVKEDPAETKEIEWSIVGIWEETKPQKFGQSLVNNGSSFGDEISLNFILGK